MNTRPAPASFGDHLRVWRRRRGKSQMAFALDAEISQRHLSFLESGRSAPSRDMLLNLAEHLDVPLRERNAMLLAAGFAPVFSERGLDDPAMQAARNAIALVLKGHEPFPALAVDGRWRLVLANDALAPLLAGVSDAELLKPPVNVLRLSLHPRGLAPQIVNLAQWREHLLERLRRQIAATSDGRLVALMQELSAYPHPSPEDKATTNSHADHADVLAPLQLRVGETVLSFISTTTIFGAPRDITLSELAVEAFFPADEATRAALMGGRRS